MIVKLRILALLFLSLFILNVKAQVHKGFRWIGPDHSLFSLNLRTGILEKETIQYGRIELGEIKNWEAIKKELPGDFDINVFPFKNYIIITIPGTGQLYRLFVSELRLERVDETFFRGYNFNASQFIRKNEIFSIGGEGFWSKHSIITKYNPKTKEWDLFGAGNDVQHPTNNLFSGYSPKRDLFFSAYLDVDSTLKNQDIHLNVFSFKTKKWETKGILEKQVIDFAKKKYKSVWTGELLVLFNDNRPNKLLLIDPFKNTLYGFNTNEGHFFMDNCDIYFRNGYLFSRTRVSSGKNDKIILDSMSLKDILASSYKLGTVYKEKSFENIYLILIIISLIVISIILFYKKFKENKILEFSEIEVLVLRELIKNNSHKKHTTVEINTLLQITNKSFDNQRQIRNRTIGGINKKLQPIINFKEFICRAPNPEDKRMIDYFINPDIKDKDIEKIMRRINV